MHLDATCSKTLENPLTDEQCKAIHEYAAIGADQEFIRRTVGVDGQTWHNSIVIQDILYRAKHQADAQVLGTYFDMARSGKHWGATKHYLAVRLGMVEKQIVEQTQTYESVLDMINDAKKELIEDGVIDEGE